MPRGSGRRATSMTSVAKLAGVSVSTVSHVVNGTRPVSREIQIRVLGAVAESGYISRGAGLPADLMRSQTIGLAMSAMSNPYFGHVVHGLEEAASDAGYSVILAETHDTDDGELRAVNNLLSRRVEAVILAPSGDPAQVLELAERSNTPVILIDRFASHPVDQIGVENIEPTATLIDHLVEIGHTRIGMIAGREQLSTSRERLDGYYLGVARNDIPLDPDLVVSGDSRADTARQRFSELMSIPKPPTALVVGNNLMTIGVMRGTKDRGIRVPRDLALVSFDDFEWADAFEPGLTAIAQPTQDIGRQAFFLVSSRLSDPNTSPRRVVIRPDFVHRDSCGCGRDTADTRIAADGSNSRKRTLPERR